MVEAESVARGAADGGAENPVRILRGLVERLEPRADGVAYAFLRLWHPGLNRDIPCHAEVECDWTSAGRRHIPIGDDQAEALRDRSFDGIVLNALGVEWDLRSPLPPDAPPPGLDGILSMVYDAFDAVGFTDEDGDYFEVELQVHVSSGEGGRAVSWIHFGVPTLFGGGRTDAGLKALLRKVNALTDALNDVKDRAAALFDLGHPWLAGVTNLRLAIPCVPDEAA